MHFTTNAYAVHKNINYKWRHANLDHKHATTIWSSIFLIPSVVAVVLEFFYVYVFKVIFLEDLISLYSVCKCQGQVQVSYCSQHRGHEFEIAHVGLRQENRQQVIETEIESDLHFGSEVEVWEHQLVPQVTESRTTFDSLESQHPDIDIERCLEYCDATYSFFRSAMRHNPQIAELTSANFSRLKELITTIISKPKSAEQLASPSKNTRSWAYQQENNDTKKKRNPHVCLRFQRIKKLKSCLSRFRSLDGNVRMVSTQPSVELNYAYDTRSQVINFEHSCSNKER